METGQDNSGVQELRHEVQLPRYAGDTSEEGAGRGTDNSVHFRQRESESGSRQRTDYTRQKTYQCERKEIFAGI